MFLKASSMNTFIKGIARNWKKDLCNTIPEWLNLSDLIFLLQLFTLKNLKQKKKLLEERSILNHPPEEDFFIDQVRKEIQYTTESRGRNNCINLVQDIKQHYLDEFMYTVRIGKGILIFSSLYRFCNAFINSDVIINWSAYSLTRRNILRSMLLSPKLKYLTNGSKSFTPPSALFKIAFATSMETLSDRKSVV